MFFLTIEDHCLVPFFCQWISVPFAITNDAVSSISANSGEAWTGEIQTKKLGIWIDYGLLLVSIFVGLY